jgi:hypothetical protein
MYRYRMSYEAKSFASTLALFYAIGAVLALRAYALNSIDDFVVVEVFWIKETITMAFTAMAYWLYYIVRGFVGSKPDVPFRSLSIYFLVTVAVSVIGLLSHG